MKNEDKPLMTIEQKDIDTAYEIEFEEECVLSHIIKITGDERILLTGSVGLWNGRRNIENTILYIEEKSDILSKINGENITINIFSDRVEIIDRGHDGTSYFTMTKFSWSNFTVEELKNVIYNSMLWDDFIEYFDEIKHRDIRKKHYVEYLDDQYDGETFDTLKRRNNENREDH